MYVFIYIYVHVYVFKCTYVYEPIRICVHVSRLDMSICTRVYMYMCTCVYLYMCTYVHVFICACVYMYTCTYVHIYMCSCLYMCIRVPYMSLCICFSDSLDLLGLLAVDSDIKIHEIFSGSYVYNLVIELSARIQPGLYCEEMLVRGSDYSNLFKR